ncbi:MAG: hypothetical protein RIE77_10230 [Phycisphaerales bacterium]|jgi:hypothetical protein
MSDIGHVHSGGHARDIQPRPAGRPPAGTTEQPGRAAGAPRRQPDRVDLSPQARAGRDAGEIRADLVIRVREEIVRGVYETSEKLDSAVDALIDDARRSG